MIQVINKKLHMPKKITLESLAVTIESLAAMVARGFEELGEKIERLEVGQEQLKLRLDNMAPRFELKQLEKRVDKIEKKIGL